MSYGILIARSDAEFQVVAEVSSPEEALELAHDYIAAANPDAGDCPPEEFEIHRRNQTGRFLLIEKVDLEMAHDFFQSSVLSSRRDTCQICHKHRRAAAHTK
jgi:hypothetical protein